VLLALASFLILDLGGSVSPSTLPVIDLGRVDQGQGDRGTAGSGSSTTSGTEPRLDDGGSGATIGTTTSSFPDAIPTGTTVHETVRGGVHTGGTGGATTESPEDTDPPDDTDPPGDDY
jgi:hypothetical protein